MRQIKDYNPPMKFTINSEICTSCGICMAECPSKTIKKDSETVYIVNEGCIECSHCGMVCPVNAVRVDGSELPPYPASLENLTPEENTDHLILSKRSVRHYKTAPLNKEDLQSIILAGETTATASNTQHCDALILQGAEVAALASTLAGVLLKFTRIGLSPVGRGLLKLAGLKRYADKNIVTGFHHLLQKTREGKADPLFHKAPAVVILTYPVKGKRFGRTDCGIAGENMMLAAHSRNIGSCMIGFAEAALFSKKQRLKLGIPADRKIGLIFTLGYSAREYYRYPARKNWSHVI